MSFRHSNTNLTLHSEINTKTLIWLVAAAGLFILYALRCLMETLPPEDHFSLSLIGCFLLTQALFSLDQTSIKLSLEYNRCWLRHHRFGRTREMSVPVTQIHSARTEVNPAPPIGAAPYSRIVLITSIGMIPLNENYSHRLHNAATTCERINQFLDSRDDFLPA